MKIEINRHYNVIPTSITTTDSKEKALFYIGSYIKAVEEVTGNNAKITIHFTSEKEEENGQAVLSD